MSIDNLQVEKLCDYEISLLRELVTGVPQDLSWGAAMSVSIEYLSGSGYLTRGPNYKVTQKGIDFIKNNP